MTIANAGKIRFALRKNSRLAYRVNGEREDAPFVFLHDALFTQSVFSSVDRPGLIPDLRGHGASASLANQWCTVTELADDVAAILDAEGASFARLVGHGLGGAVALEFARKFPDRAQALVLIEPNVSSLLDKDLDRGARTLRDERRKTDRAAADAAYKGLIDKSLDGYLTPRFGADWRLLASKPRLAAIRRNAGALAGILPALDSYAPARGDLERIPAAAILLAGPDAAPVDQLSLARLATILPNATIEAWSFSDRLNDPFAGSDLAALIV